MSEPFTVDTQKPRGQGEAECHFLGVSPPFEAPCHHKKTTLQGVSEQGRHCSLPSFSLGLMLTIIPRFWKAGGMGETEEEGCLRATASPESTLTQKENRKTRDCFQTISQSHAHSSQGGPPERHNSQGLWRHRLPDIPSLAPPSPNSILLHPALSCVL